MKVSRKAALPELSSGLSPIGVFSFQPAGEEGLTGAPDPVWGHET